MHAYQVPNTEGFVKLDAMENPHSLPAPFKQEWLSYLSQAELNRYPDPHATQLKQAFRKVFALSSTLELLFGNGSDELIQLLILAIAKSDACILTVMPSFSMYKIIAEFVGVRVIEVPLAADSFALQTDLVCKEIQQNNPALIFLACPNNPTGTLWPQQEVEKIIQQANGLVVIDEAYVPFASYSMMKFVEQYSHVLLLRTLSKIGLAGLRLGWLLGAQQWLHEFSKLRLPYNVNVLTQASANFALNNFSVFNDQAKLICEQRAQLSAAMQKINGIQVFPSEANFILLKTLKTPCEIVFQHLLENKIMVKNVANNHTLENCLRVTVGTEKENQVFLAALEYAVA